MKKRAKEILITDQTPNEVPATSFAAKRRQDRLRELSASSKKSEHYKQEEERLFTSAWVGLDDDKYLHLDALLLGASQVAKRTKNKGVAISGYASDSPKVKVIT